MDIISFLFAIKPCNYFEPLENSFSTNVVTFYFPHSKRKQKKGEKPRIPEQKNLECRCAIPAAAPPLRVKDNPGSEMELAWISSIFIPDYPLLPSPDISRRSLDGAKGSGNAKVKIASCLGVRFKRNSYIPGEFGERLFREEEDRRESSFTFCSCEWEFGQWMWEKVLLMA